MCQLVAREKVSKITSGKKKKSHRPHASLALSEGLELALLPP